MTKFLGFGVGLRPPHYSYVLSNKINVDWFEIISENFMGLQNSGKWGRHRQFLEGVRGQYPIVMHGVSLSIGSTDELDFNYLERLKCLAEQIEPAWISDHVCWTGVGGENLHDLLPLPYTKEALDHVVGRILQVQDFIGRQFVFENVSAYFTYTHSEMHEWEFLSEMCKRSGCKLLLDVNNVYVSARNQNFDPTVFLNAIPVGAVQQFHIAGHTDNGTHVIDTHDHPVCEEVWELYKLALGRFGKISTLLEWDANIPEFPVLEVEVGRARKIFGKVTHEPAHVAQSKGTSTLVEVGTH